MIRSFLKPVGKFRKTYLPGIVTGGADDDPSAISTLSTIGAVSKFSQLWLVLLSTPLIIAVHYIAAKIGDVAKKGLITVIKEFYGKKAAFLCVAVLVGANLITLIADIVGMAAGFQLLTGESYIYFIVPLTILLWYVLVFDSYQKISRYFFWFSGILLTYVVSAFLMRPDWLLIFKETLIPKFEFNLAYLAGALGILGATFSPYTFFWQTEEEIEEKRTARDLRKTGRAMTLGFVYSNLIGFFIIVASAGAVSDLNFSSMTIGDIAQALAPVAGKWAPKIFGIGLIGSGLLAIPILASSSAYAIAEYFQWPQGLNKEPKRAKGFYAVITVSFVLCLLALFFKLNPIRIIVFSQIFVGAITPVLIFFLIKIARNKKIMGNYCCGFWPTFGAWLTIILLIASDFLLIYFLI